MRIERDGDTSTEVVEASLPAVVSVTDQINEPAVPVLQGDHGGEEEAGADAGRWPTSGVDAGRGRASAGAWTGRGRVTRAPAAPGGQNVTDEGDGGAQAGRVPGRRRSSSDPLELGRPSRRSKEPHEQVLVLVDHASGAVRKTTLELLTLARRLGEPAAVLRRARARTPRAPARSPSTARRRSTSSSRRGRRRLPGRAQGRGVLAAAGRRRSPAAVLHRRSAPEGKEIAGRLAVKLDTGLLTDAVDVPGADGLATQAVFAGGVHRPVPGHHGHAGRSP